MLSLLFYRSRSRWKNTRSRSKTDRLRNTGPIYLFVIIFSFLHCTEFRIFLLVLRPYIHTVGTREVMKVPNHLLKLTAYSYHSISNNGFLLNLRSRWFYCMFWIYNFIHLFAEAESAGQGDRAGRPHVPWSRDGGQLGGRHRGLADPRHRPCQVRPPLQRCRPVLVIFTLGGKFTDNIFFVVANSTVFNHFVSSSTRGPVLLSRPQLTFWTWN